MPGWPPLARSALLSKRGQIRKSSGAKALALNPWSKINTRECNRTTSLLNAPGGNNRKPQSGISVRSDKTSTTW